MRVSVLRVVAAVIPALLLCGCMRDPLVSTSSATPAGNWKIEGQTDRITGAPLASALLQTRSSSISAVPFAQPAMMQLTCFKGQPLVRFSFEFKVGTNKTSVLGYRFDEKTGREVEARFLHEAKVVVIDGKAEVTQFINELATSNVLYLRIRSLGNGRTSAEFRLDGAPAAIAHALAGCPVTPGAPQQRSARLT